MTCRYLFTLTYWLFHGRIDVYAGACFQIESNRKKTQMRRDRLPPQGTQPPSPSLSLSLSLSLSFSLFLSLSLSLSLSHSVTPSVSGTMHQFLMCVAPEPRVFFHPRANRITITTFLDISRSGSRRRRQSRLVSSSSFEREFFSFSSSDSSSFFFSFYLLLLWRLFRAQRWVWIWPISV